MSDWKPSSKYEVAPGLWIGSEIEDIDREHKQLMGKLINGDESVKPRMRELQAQRMKLLAPRGLKL